MSRYHTCGAWLDCHIGNKHTPLSMQENVLDGLAEWITRRPQMQVELLSCIDTFGSWSFWYFYFKAHGNALQLPPNWWGEKKSTIYSMRVNFPMMISLLGGRVSLLITCDPVWLSSFWFKDYISQYKHIHCTVTDEHRSMSETECHQIGAR